MLVQATIAAAILTLRSCLLITNGNTFRLDIVTVTSILLCSSYIAMLVAQFSPSFKEIAFGGLLVALVGSFSFSQNFVVDEFVDLNLPQLPDISPQNQVFNL